MKRTSRGALAVLTAQLERALARPLPGRAAQLRMAPHPADGSPLRRPANDGTPAAALAGFFDRGGAPHLLLTVRSADLPAHRGQISFPGGRVDADESAAACALREAEEEVGLGPDRVRLLGRLSPLWIPVSGYRVQPFVGVLDPPPDWKPNPREVARILEVPLSRLQSPASLLVREQTIFGQTYRVPYFDLEAGALWGATAMMIGELLSVLGPGPQPPTVDGA